MIDESQRSSWLPRSWFLILLAHTFFLQMITVVFRVATTYRALEIGLDAFWIGVIGGAFGILPAFLGLHIGKVLDQRGEILALRLASAVVLVFCFGFWWLGHSLAMLLLCSVGLGLGQFICAAAQHSAIARCVSDEKRHIYFGRFTVAVSLSQVAGPMLVSFFGRDALVPETDGIFMAGTGLGVALALAAILLRLTQHVRPTERIGAWKTASTLMRGKGFTLSVSAGLVLFSAMDLLVIYLPLFGTERHIPADVIGLLLAVRAGASIACRLMFGRLIAWFGRSWLLTVSLIVAGLAIAAVPFTEQIPLLMVEMAVAGMGLGCGAPITLSWVTEISPLGMRASALSLRLAFNRVGQAVLPIAVGTLVAGLGASGVLGVIALSLVGTGGMTARFFKLWRPPGQRD